MKLPHATLALALFPLFTGVSSALTPFSDNFNAATLNKARWSLENNGKGKLAHGNGRINFTVSGKPTDDDYGLLELKNNQPGYNESWEAILDVKNALKGTTLGTGMLIHNADDYEDQVSLEFNGKTGFVSVSITDDEDNAEDDIRKVVKISQGSIRISFDKTTKLLSFWYDKTGSADGFAWKRFATFSPTGKGGDRRGNWKMNPGGGRFGIQLYAFAEERTVAAGKVSFDNFKLRAVK